MPTLPVVYAGRPIDTQIGTTINVDFSADLTLDHESEMPLMAFLSRLRDDPVLTYIFKYAIGRFVPRSATAPAQTNAVAQGSDTTITVAAGKGVYFLPGDVIMGPDTNNDATHTNIMIVKDVAGDALTVRAYDPATFGTSLFVAGATFRVLYSAMREGGSGRSSRQTVPTVYTNYVFTQEDYYDVTRLQAKNRQYTDPERSRLREEARKKHALDGEYAAFISRKAVDTTAGGTGGGTSTKAVYHTDGLDAMISTNALSYGSVLTFDELADFMTSVHNPQYSGGMRRTVFASGGVMGDISKMALGGLRITNRETSWGVTISEINFAGKTWGFIEAPALSDALPGYAFVTHPAYMKKRTFWPTMFEANVQNPIDKFYKDGFYSVWGMEVRLEELFGRIKP